MIRDAFVLLERSLRIDARSGSAHLARLGLMGTIYLALWYTLVTKPQFGAPGLHFFQGIAYLDATFMTLLGIGFFSTSITEEKEEDTLGLMLMAGISPLGILVGKSGGRPTLFNSGPEQSGGRLDDGDRPDGIFSDSQHRSRNSDDDCP